MAASILRTLMWLAALGLIVLVASRFAGKAGARASAGLPV